VAQTVQGETDRGEVPAMIVFCCVGDFPVRDQEIFEEVVNGSGGGIWECCLVGK